MSKVLVAVRIRPQSEREIANGSQEAVKVSGQNLQVNNVKLENQNFKLADSRSWVKTFVFDRIYWSVNSVSPNFVTQEMIYNDLGMEILSSTFCGYNACLFAYGQTGSGKTYTMMGNENDLGLIPRICQGLFNYIHDKTDGGDNSKASYTVNVSYMEIYKEKVCDLLVPSSPSKDPGRQHLRIREHPVSGPYVEGLTRHHVKDNRGIQSLIAKGNNSRTVAATRIHDKSSRSHAIFTIYFTSALLDEQFPSKTVSKINMVDLAGSERADATSAFDKNRMKEGSLINKSLTTLGSVIQALAKRSVLSFWDNSQSSQKDGQASQQSSTTPALPSGRRRSIFIPYRDSVLTWLLKDSLGGNSKTIMIATISPSDLCYSETVNTLHYAHRAKTIVNRPVVNEDPVARLIRDLREEIARLQSLLRSQAVGSGDTSIMIDSEIAVKLEESKQKALELTKSFFDRCHVEQDLLEDGGLSIKSLNRTNSFGVVLDSRLPHLICMDDDMLNTGIVLYQLKDGETKVGNEEAESFVDIVLDSEDILFEHCSFRNSNNEVTLEPNSGALIRVNDRRVTKPIRLSQGDVIFLGNGHMFRYNNPQEAAEIRERRRSQLGGDGRMPGALSRCSSLSSINTSSGIDVESPSDSPLSSQLSRSVSGINLANTCSHLEQRQNFEDNERLRHSIEELERLKNECRQAKLALMEKEEALFQTHEANRLQFEAKQSQLEEQMLQNEREREEAWNEIERMRTELEELRAKYVDGNIVPSESDTKSELHGLLYLSPEELEEQISNWKQEIVKAFEIKSEHLDLEKASLKASEDRFRSEDEERLEAVNRQNQYLIELENKRMNLVYFIEKAENVYPSKFDSVLPRSASLSDCRFHRHETELSGDFHSSTDNNYSVSDNVSKVSSDNLAGFNELPVNSIRPFVPELQARRLDKSGQLRKLLPKSSSSGKLHSIPSLSGTLRSHTLDGGLERSYVSATDQDISRSSSYPSLPELCDTRESTAKAGNFTFGKPLQFSSMANLASVPESLNEDFDESPVSGKVSASAQDLEQWSPVSRSAPWMFDALTSVNPRRGAQAQKTRNDNLSNFSTQRPDTSRKGHSNFNSLASTSTPLPKSNKKIKPKCGPSGDEESTSPKDVHKISTTSGKTSESVNKRQSVPTKKQETSRTLSQMVERKDAEKQPLSKRLPSSLSKDQSTVKVKSAKRSPEGSKTLTKPENGDGDVLSSTKVNSPLSPVNKDLRDKTVELQHKTKSPNKASTSKKCVPPEPNASGKTNGKRIFGENIDIDALKHGAETTELASTVDIYAADMVSGSDNCLSTVEPTPGALGELEITCSTSLGKSETGKTDDVELRSTGVEFSDDSLDGEEMLDDRTEFRPQMKPLWDISDIPADQDLSNFDQSKLDVLSKIPADCLALQSFSDDSLNDENRGDGKQSRIISSGLFFESSPKSLHISAELSNVHGGDIHFDNPADISWISQTADSSFLMSEGALLEAKDADGIENTSPPGKKVGKTGKRSGRRRVHVRPINTGASTTESDGNDIYDGMSDDSLTLGLKHKLPSHGTHGSLKRKKRPHHHESSAKVLSDCSLADADYISSEDSSNVSDEDFETSRKSSIEAVGAKLASTFKGASEDEPSGNSSMCLPDLSDLHQQTTGSHLHLWTGDYGALVSHTQDLRIGFSQQECWNTLDSPHSAVITDGGITSQDQRIPLGICEKSGDLEGETVRAKNLLNLGFSRMLVYDASLPLDSETLTEDTLTEKIRKFASPDSVQSHSCLDTLTVSLDENKPVSLSSSDLIQTNLMIQNSDEMEQPTNKESILSLTLSNSLPSKETNKNFSVPHNLDSDDGLVALSIISERPIDFYSLEGVMEPEQNLNAELPTVVLSRVETEDISHADSHSHLKQAESDVDQGSATVVVKETNFQKGVSCVLVSENVTSETVDSDHFDSSSISNKNIVTLEQKPDGNQSTGISSKSEIGIFVSVPGDELLEKELMSDVAQVPEDLPKGPIHSQKGQSFDLSHGHITDKIPPLETDRALLELSDSNETTASLVSGASSEQELNNHSTNLAADENTIQKQMVRDINENSQHATMHLGANLDATTVSKSNTIAITNGVDVTMVVPSDSLSYTHGDSKLPLPTESEYDVVKDENKNEEFIRSDSVKMTDMKQDLGKHVVSTVDAEQDGRNCGNQEEDEAVEIVLDVEASLTTLGEMNHEESENPTTSAAGDPVHQRIDHISENSLAGLLCEGHNALELRSEDELFGSMSKSGQSNASDFKRSCVERYLSPQYGSLDNLHKYAVCSVMEKSLAAQTSVPDAGNCINGNDVAVKHQLRRSWSSGALDNGPAVHKELLLSFSKSVPIFGDVGIKSSAIKHFLHTEVKSSDGPLHNYGKNDHIANNLGTEKHANEEDSESCQTVLEQNISSSSKISDSEILIGDSKTESLPEPNDLIIHSLQQSSSEDRMCNITVKVDKTSDKKQKEMNQSEDVTVLEMKLASDTDPSNPFVDVEVPLCVDFDGANNKELNAKRSHQEIDGMQNSETVHNGLVYSNDDIINGDFTSTTSQLVNGDNSPKVLLIPEDNRRNSDFNSERIVDNITVGSEHKSGDSSLMVDAESKHSITEDSRTKTEIYDTLCLDRNNKLVFPQSLDTTPAGSCHPAVDGDLDVSLPESLKEVTDLQALSNSNFSSETGEDNSCAGVNGFVDDREATNSREFQNVTQNLISENDSSEGKNLELGVLADPCMAGVGIKPAHDVLSDLDSGISASENYATDSTTDNEMLSPARQAARESNNFQGANHCCRVDTSVAADDKEATTFLVSRPGEESVRDPSSCIVSVPCQHEKQSLSSEIELGCDVKAVETDRSTECNKLQENIAVNHPKCEYSEACNLDSYKLLDESVPINVVHDEKSDSDTDLKSESLSERHDKSFSVEISDYKDSDIDDVAKAYISNIVASAILQVKDENIGEWPGIVCNEDNALSNIVPSRGLRYDENSCETETGESIISQKDIAEIGQSINATCLPDELDDAEPEQDSDMSSLATESEDTSNVGMSFSDKKFRVRNTDGILASNVGNQVIEDTFSDKETDECSGVISDAEVSYRRDYAQTSDESLPLKFDEALAHTFSTENAKKASIGRSEVEDITEQKDRKNDCILDSLEAKMTSGKDLALVESKDHFSLLAVTDIDSDCSPLVRVPEAESKEWGSCSRTDGTNSLSTHDSPVNSFKSESHESVEAVNQTQATAEATSGLDADEIGAGMIETPAAAYALILSTAGNMTVDNVACHWPSTAGNEVSADSHLREDLLHQEDHVVSQKELDSPLTDDDDIISTEETKFAGIADVTKIEEDKEGSGLLNVNLCSTADPQTSNNANSSVVSQKELDSPLTDDDDIISNEETKFAGIADVTKIEEDKEGSGLLNVNLCSTADPQTSNNANSSVVSQKELDSPLTDDDDIISNEETKFAGIADVTKIEEDKEGSGLLNVNLCSTADPQTSNNANSSVVSQKELDSPLTNDDDIISNEETKFAGIADVSKIEEDKEGSGLLNVNLCSIADPQTSNYANSSADFGIKAKSNIAEDSEKNTDMEPHSVNETGEEERTELCPGDNVSLSVEISASHTDIIEVNQVKDNVGSPLTVKSEQLTDGTRLKIEDELNDGAEIKDSYEYTLKENRENNGDAVATIESFYAAIQPDECKPGSKFNDAVDFRPDRDHITADVIISDFADHDVQWNKPDKVLEKSTEIEEHMSSAGIGVLNNDARLPVLDIQATTELIYGKNLVLEKSIDFPDNAKDAVDSNLNVTRELTDASSNLTVTRLNYSQDGTMKDPCHQENEDFEGDKTCYMFPENNVNSSQLITDNMYTNDRLVSVSAISSSDEKGKDTAVAMADLESGSIAENSVSAVNILPSDESVEEIVKPFRNDDTVAQHEISEMRGTKDEETMETLSSDLAFQSDAFIEDDQKLMGLSSDVVVHKYGMVLNGENVPRACDEVEMTTAVENIFGVGEMERGLSKSSVEGEIAGTVSYENDKESKKPLVTAAQCGLESEDKLLDENSVRLGKGIAELPIVSASGFEMGNVLVEEVAELENRHGDKLVVFPPENQLILDKINGFSNVEIDSVDKSKGSSALVGTLQTDSQSKEVESVKCSNEQTDENVIGSDALLPSSQIGNGCEVAAVEDDKTLDKFSAPLEASAETMQVSVLKNIVTHTRTDAAKSAEELQAEALHNFEDKAECFEAVHQENKEILPADFIHKLDEVDEENLLQSEDEQKPVDTPLAIRSNVDLLNSEAVDKETKKDISSAKQEICSSDIVYNEETIVAEEFDVKHLQVDEFKYEELIVDENRDNINVDLDRVLIEKTVPVSYLEIQKNASSESEMQSPFVIENGENKLATGTSDAMESNQDFDEKATCMELTTSEEWQTKSLIVCESDKILEQCQGDPMSEETPLPFIVKNGLQITEDANTGKNAIEPEASLFEDDVKCVQDTNDDRRPVFWGSDEHDSNLTPTHAPESKFTVLDEGGLKEEDGFAGADGGSNLLLNGEEFTPETQLAVDSELTDIAEARQLDENIDGETNDAVTCKVMQKEFQSDRSSSDADKLMPKKSIEKHENELIESKSVDSSKFGESSSDHFHCLRIEEDLERKEIVNANKFFCKASGSENHLVEPREVNFASHLLEDGSEECMESEDALVDCESKLEGDVLSMNKTTSEERTGVLEELKSASVIKKTIEKPTDSKSEHLDEKLNDMGIYTKISNQHEQVYITGSEVKEEALFETDTEDISEGKQEESLEERRDNYEAALVADEKELSAGDVDALKSNNEGTDVNKLRDIALSEEQTNDNMTFRIEGSAKTHSLKDNSGRKIEAKQTKASELESQINTVDSAEVLNEESVNSKNRGSGQLETFTEGTEVKRVEKADISSFIQTEQTVNKDTFSEERCGAVFDDKNPAVVRKAEENNVKDGAATLNSGEIVTEKETDSFKMETNKMDIRITEDMKNDESGFGLPKAELVTGDRDYITTRDNDSGARVIEGKNSSVYVNQREAGKMGVVRIFEDEPKSAILEDTGGSINETNTSISTDEVTVIKTNDDNGSSAEQTGPPRTTGMDASLTAPYRNEVEANGKSLSSRHCEGESDVSNTSTNRNDEKETSNRETIEGETDVMSSRATYAGEEADIEKTYGEKKSSGDERCVKDRDSNSRCVGLNLETDVQFYKDAESKGTFSSCSAKESGILENDNTDIIKAVLPSTVITETATGGADSLKHVIIAADFKKPKEGETADSEIICRNATRMKSQDKTNSAVNMPDIAGAQSLHSDSLSADKEAGLQDMIVSGMLGIKELETMMDSDKLTDCEARKSDAEKPERENLDLLKINAESAAAVFRETVSQDWLGVQKDKDQERPTKAADSKRLSSTEKELSETSTAADANECDASKINYPDLSDLTVSSGDTSLQSPSNIDSFSGKSERQLHRQMSESVHQSAIAQPTELITETKTELDFKSESRSAGTKSQGNANAAVNMPGTAGAQSLHSDSSSANKPCLDESHSAKRSLKDTEVLGLDLLPTQPGFIIKSHKRTELEIVSGGHSRLGFPREASADVEFQFIGLQPLDKQPPKFSPECEKILRDELSSPYRHDFIRIALDIEIKPHSSGLCPDPNSDFESARTSELSVINSRDVLTEQDSKLFKANVEEDIEVVEKCNSWSSETNLESASYIGTQASRQYGVDVRQPSVVNGANRTPCPLKQRHETDECLSSGFHAFDKKFSTSSRGFTSQTMDSGIWERTTSESELNQVGRLSPISANTALSKSDEDLLGSESVLFEGIIPSFKALPSTIESDSLNVKRNRFVEGDGHDRIYQQEFRQHFPLQDFSQERKLSDPDKKQYRSLSPKRTRRTRSESSDSLTYAYVPQSHSDDEEHHRLHQKRHKDADALTFTRTASASEIFQPQPSENFRIKSLQRSTSLDVLDNLFTEDIAPENIFGPSSSRHPDVLYRRLQVSSQGSFSAVRVSPILDNLAVEEYGSDANIMTAVCSLQDSEVNEPDDVLCNYPQKNDSTEFAYGRLKVQPLAAREKASYGEKYRIFEDARHSELLRDQQRLHVATSGASVEYDRKGGTRSSDNRNSFQPSSVMMDANQKLSLFRRLKLIDASTQSDSNRPESGERFHGKDPMVVGQQSSVNVDSMVPGSWPQSIGGGDQRERLFGRTEWDHSERLRNRASLSQADLRFSDVSYSEHLLKRFSTSELPYRRTIETQTYPETRGIETQTYIWLEPGKKGVKSQTHPIDCLTYDTVGDLVSRDLTELIVRTGFNNDRQGIGVLYPLHVDESYNEKSGGMLLGMGSRSGVSSLADDLQVGKGHSLAGEDSIRWKEKASREVASKAVEPSIQRATTVEELTTDSIGAGTTVHTETQRSNVRDNTKLYDSHDARYQQDDLSYFSAEGNASIRSERGSITRDVASGLGSSSERQFHGQVRVMMDSTGDDKAESSPQGTNLTLESANESPFKSNESFSDFRHGNWTQGTVRKSDLSSFGDALHTQSDTAITSSPHTLSEQKHRGSQALKKDFHDVAMRISFDEPCSYAEDIGTEFDTTKEQNISERYVTGSHQKIPTPSHRVSNDLTNEHFSRQDQSFDPAARISQPSFRHETSDNLDWSSVRNRTHYLSELSDLGQEHNLTISVAPGNISSGTQDSGVDDFRFSSPGETSCQSSVNFDFPTFTRSRFRFGEAMSASRGCSVELERLRAERQRIVELLARDIVPSKVQVDLAEAQLHYLIGQADLLLQTIDEHEDLDQRKVMDTMKAPEERLTDFGARYLNQYRSKLELARLRIERQIQELERKQVVSRIRLSELIRNDDKMTTQMRYKQRKSEKIDQPQFSGSETNRTSSIQRPCKACGSNSVNTEGLSPSQMQHYLMSIRREVVAATRLNDTTPPMRSSTLATQSLGRVNTRPSVNNQRQYASFSNLRSQMRETALRTSQDEWFPGHDSGSDHLRHDRSHRRNVPFNDDSSQLLDECQKVRRRAQNEISEAMKVLNKTSPNRPHPHSNYGSDSHLYAKDKGQPFEQSVQRDGTSVDHSIPLALHHQSQSLSTSSLPRSFAFDRSMFGNTYDILNSSLGGEKNSFENETKRHSSVEDLSGGRSFAGLSREHSFPSESTLTASSFRAYSSRTIDPPLTHRHGAAVGHDGHARMTGPLHSDRFARPVPFGPRRSGERTASGALLDELGTSSDRYESNYSVDARHFRDPHHLH